MRCGNRLRPKNVHFAGWSLSSCHNGGGHCHLLCRICFYCNENRLLDFAVWPCLNGNPRALGSEMNLVPLYIPASSAQTWHCEAPQGSNRWKLRHFCYFPQPPRFLTASDDRTFPPEMEMDGICPRHHSLELAQGCRSQATSQSAGHT
jgi:hypothetical protein